MNGESITQVFVTKNFGEGVVEKFFHCVFNVVSLEFDFPLCLIRYSFNDTFGRYFKSERYV